MVKSHLSAKFSSLTRTLLNNAVERHNKSLSKKVRGNNHTPELDVKVDGAGIKFIGTFTCPPPGRFVLSAYSEVLEDLKTTVRGDAAEAVLGPEAFDELFTAGERIQQARQEVEEPSEVGEPLNEVEAEAELPGLTFRAGWAWTAQDGEVPDWCSSVLLEDGSMAGRKKWLAARNALEDEGESESDESASSDSSATEDSQREDLGAAQLAALDADMGIRWVGQAQETDLEIPKALEVGQHLVRPYVNRRGFVSISVDRPLKPAVTAWADAVDATDGNFVVTGRIATRHDRIASAEFVLRARATDTEFRVPAALRLDQRWTSHDRGRGHYSYSAKLVIPEARWDEIDPGDNYDARFVVWLVGLDEPVDVRVNKVPLATRIATNSGAAHAKDGRVLSLSPYYTFKAKALSAKLEAFDRDVYEAMTGLVPPRDNDRPVWLIGELPYKAQDNGMHFYNWMRSYHPEIEAYYVIDADSPEKPNLIDPGHVVDHGSKQHVVLSLQADRFVGSHHADFLYPTRNPKFVKRLTGSRVFMQHGVMGTKWMVPNYGKKASGFATDLFLASSEYEKGYLVGDFGYSPEEIVVTGLPRFDRLLAGKGPANQRRVVVMPTWRDWLQSDDDSFLESDYYLAWHGLLTSQAFADVVREYDLDVVLCLHPNMQRYTSYFASVPAKVVSQGEENVQDLMMESACMITDYSSVGFDFSFQHRPVVYYQFDRGRFLGPNGSHLDLDKELPGLIASRQQEVIEDLRILAAEQFAQPEELRRRSDKFLDNRDLRANERVYQAVLTAGARKKDHDGEIAAVPDALFRRFRRHRLYYPIMRSMNAAMRRLPVREDLLVFESGLGKQYADSPRYIYEELLSRGDTRQKVWIHSGNPRLRDPNTKVVKRLSPSYFYYLARARYITTNQNLPFYLKRHRNATYVQTWHGTPLKRMQHDMVDMTGHADDYLSRVEAATSQWTHLLSPSEYATKAFRSAFKYQGPVVEEGYPRNDPLLAPDAADVGQATRERLGIDEHAKVVLYAPTFRDDQATARGQYSFELPFDLEETLAGLPDDVVLLLRMHVLVGSKIAIPEHLLDRVKNVSTYPEIQDLYLASDVLVTDYSSVFFDAALLRRPIIFHAYDLDQYRDNLRGFYLDYEHELPGPITRTQHELVETIGHVLDHDIDQAKRSKFLKKFAPFDDGHAASRIVDKLYTSTNRSIGVARRILAKVRPGS